MSGQTLYSIYCFLVVVVGQAMIVWEIGRKGWVRLGLEGPGNRRVTFALMLFISMFVIGSVGHFTFPFTHWKHAALVLAWLLSVLFVSRQLLPASQRLFDRARFLHESTVAQYSHHHERGPGASFEDIRADSRLQEAERLYLRAMEIESRRPRGELNVAVAHHQLGFLYRQLGKFEEARKRFEKSLQILRSLESLQPERSDIQGTISRTLFRLAEICHAHGELEQAKKMYEQSLDIDQRLGDAAGIRSNHQMLAEIDGKKAE